MEHEMETRLLILFYFCILCPRAGRQLPRGMCWSDSFLTIFWRASKPTLLNTLQRLLGFLDTHTCSYHVSFSRVLFTYPLSTNSRVSWHIPNPCACLAASLGALDTPAWCERLCLGKRNLPQIRGVPQPDRPAGLQWDAGTNQPNPHLIWSVSKHPKLWNQQAIF